MSNKPNNPPAFVNVGDGGNYDGMTLRDYFAAKSIAPMITAVFNHAVASGIPPEKLAEIWSMKELAKGCYGLADAMLAERSK